jgi:hypothetical protein
LAIDLGITTFPGDTTQLDQAKLARRKLVNFVAHSCDWLEIEKVDVYAEDMGI